MSLPLIPNLTLLHSYSATDDLVERAPIITHFERADKHLFFVNAFHGIGTDNPTCDAIRQAFDSHDPRFLIIEGFPSAWGENPQKYLNKISDLQKEGFALAGESTVSASIALLRNVPFQGGEPSDAELWKIARSRGYSSFDYVAYQLLLYIPQDLIERPSCSESELRELMQIRLEKDFSFLEAHEVPTMQQFLDWVTTHHRSPELIRITSDDIMPSEDWDATFPQRLTNCMTRARDEHLLQLITSRLEEVGRVLVVYGDGHLVTCRAVLEDMLGTPVEIYPSSAPYTLSRKAD